MINANTKICLIIGDPVAHSLSPVLHNFAYSVDGLSEKFVYLAAHVKPDQLSAAVNGVKALGIRGLTCTIPHKEEIIKYLDEIEETAKKIGAVNTVINENGRLIGYNTDYLGAVKPLQQITDLTGANIAILGAGGVSKAIVYGLKQEAAVVKVYNRSLKRAVELAEQTGVAYGKWENLAEVQNADIIFNATSVGMSPNIEESPIDPKNLNPKQIVVESIYTPYKTKLLLSAEEIGCKVIPGMEMFLHQAIAQYELYTLNKAPIEAMREFLAKHFNS